MNETFDKELLVETIRTLLEDRDEGQLRQTLNDLHPADIAQLIDSFDYDEMHFIISLLDNDVSAATLLELEEEDRTKILSRMSPREIAEAIIEEMESDDAADVISELSRDMQQEVIDELEDEEHARAIIDLLQYSENTAGGLMGKEVVKISHNLTILNAVREIRRQSDDIEEVYNVYVVDDDDKLLGTLNLIKLLTSSSNRHIKDLYNPKFHYVRVTDEAESVAEDIAKYDLFEVPVLDGEGRLVGNITVDDVIDFIQDEADRDYQLASGISEDVDIQDSYWSLIKARLPWLFIGVAGSIISSRILDGNLSVMAQVPMLILFIPLIAATAGNMGVQSSAIVVQSLANGSANKNIWKNVSKEMLMGLISGATLGVAMLLVNLFLYGEIKAGITISVSLLAVVLVAAFVGTIIPLILDKRGINPAFATGPFITTSNDVIGITIYFLIAKLILGI